MKCWNCSHDCPEGAIYCGECGASLRDGASTPEGGALRQLLLRYGKEKLLGTPGFLQNALGDVIESPEPLRTHFGLAMNVGLGQLLLKQLNASGGAPDEAFARQAEALLTGEAGLSEQAAKKLLACVWDMLQWQQPHVAEAAAPQVTAPAAPQAQVSAPPQAVTAPAGRPVTWLGVIGVAAVLLAHAMDAAMGVLALYLPPSFGSFWLRLGSSATQNLAMLLTLLPSVLLLAVPYFQRRKAKTQAMACAAGYAVVALLMTAVTLARFHATMVLSQLPMLLAAALLLHTTLREGAFDKQQTLWWGLAALSLIVFVLLSFVKSGSEAPVFTTRWWMVKNWWKAIFFSGSVYLDTASDVAPTFLAPLYRAMVMALMALNIRRMAKQ